MLFVRPPGWINVMDGSRRFLFHFNYPAEKYLSKESCKSFAEIKYKFLLIYEAVLNVSLQKSLNILPVSFTNIYYEVVEKRDECSRPCIIWALSHFSRYVFWLSSAWASSPSNLQSRVCGTLRRGAPKTKHALALISAAQNLRQTLAPSAKCFIAGRTGSWTTQSGIFTRFLHACAACEMGSFLPQTVVTLRRKLWLLYGSKETTKPSCLETNSGPFAFAPQELQLEKNSDLPLVHKDTFSLSHNQLTHAHVYDTHSLKDLFLSPSQY